MSKKSSFQVALAALERNSIGAKEAQALKVCEAADDLLAALRNILSYVGDCSEGEAQDIARAAIRRATS